MGIIQWHKNLSVGIQQLDTQHKKLIEIINSLYNIITEEEDRQHLQEILDEMKDYTVSHFATEEKYFQRFSYPGTAEHVHQHSLFIKKLKEFLEGFAQGSFSLTFQMMDFLQDWLVYHIMETDKKYSEFFQKHGLS